MGTSADIVGRPPGVQLSLVSDLEVSAATSSRLCTSAARLMLRLDPRLETSSRTNRGHQPVPSTRTSYQLSLGERGEPWTMRLVKATGTGSSPRDRVNFCLRIVATGTATRLEPWTWTRCVVGSASIEGSPSGPTRTPEIVCRLLVSPRLRTEFGNGEQFYQGRPTITVPGRRADQPHLEFSNGTSTPSSMLPEHPRVIEARQ
jgi:hypothetical protein